MTEITRVQFAFAAVAVALLAWAAGRALAPDMGGGRPGTAAVAATVTGAGGRAGTARGEPGTAASAPAGGGTGGADPGVSLARLPAREIVVHVAGAVRRPGVYRLRDGDRIADAVRKAGGRARSADLDAINLAAKARDGGQILVPRRPAPAGAAAGAGAVAPTTAAPGGPAVAAPTPGSAPTPAAPFDLNTATAEQLDTLDGVGPATAAKILRFRAEHGPFRSVDDLEQIPGIGPKRLAAIRPRVRV